MNQERDICAGKHGGNEESEAAFERALNGMPNARMAVFKACWRPGGVSCRELAAEWNVDMNTISGRFSELKRDDLIIKHEVRDKSAACIPNPKHFPHYVLDPER